MMPAIAMDAAQSTIRRGVGFPNSNLLGRYFLVSYAAVLINAAGLLQYLQGGGGALTVAFTAAAFLTYCLIYLAPVFIPLLLLDFFMSRFSLSRRVGPRARRWIICTIAIFGTSLVQVLIYTDRIIFDMYGFHLNGFVWNLVFTRGGLASLGGSDSTNRTIALIIIFLFAVQALLLAVVVGVPRIQLWLGRLVTRRRVVVAFCLAFGAGMFERTTYGVCSLRGYRPVLASSGILPFYMPTTLTKLAQSLGFEVVRRSEFDFDNSSSRVCYPRHPIERVTLPHPPNIVWLVAESLRADMLDPEIMPATWKLAQSAVSCSQHYSGGNGTRMGMFSMFYGLYGSFWFPIFDEQRSPVMMDVVHDMGYQMDMFTSASFTYPEFDRTMFVNVPADKLHEAGTALPWRRDIENIDSLLKFIDQRDVSTPFMTFMFFESTHAPYHFPSTAVIRRPYLEDLNYATMDLHKDITPIKNRYINACNHVDSQIARVLDYLKEHDLMDSTIVMVTGDHGEEFMENGRWGHNWGFTDGQTRPPMVLSIPGQGHREITRLTSHLDIPATMLPLLGVKNPPADYSLGHDILGDTERTYTVICDWYHIALINEAYKIVLPFKAYGFAEETITTRDDKPPPEMKGFEDFNRTHLVQLLNDMRTFSR